VGVSALTGIVALLSISTPIHAARAQEVCPSSAYTVLDSASTAYVVAANDPYQILSPSVSVSSTPAVIAGTAGFGDVTNKITIFVPGEATAGTTPPRVSFDLDFDMIHDGNTCHVGPLPGFVTQARANRGEAVGIGEPRPGVVFIPREDPCSQHLCVRVYGGRLSPIVVDLGEPGLELTGLDDPVQFDLDADGRAEITAWTATDSPDAFLVLDRNRNGTIDDGMELFGNAVDLRSGDVSAQGYEALAEFDLAALGGNENGFVDLRDDLYWALRLWTDRNHNGISEPEELRTLFTEGIFAIDLAFVAGMQVDEHGNLSAFTSPAFSLRRGRVQHLTTTDVFFGILETDE